MITQLHSGYLANGTKYKEQRLQTYILHMHYSCSKRSKKYLINVKQSYISKYIAANKKIKAQNHPQMFHLTFLVIYIFYHEPGCHL